MYADVTALLSVTRLTETPGAARPTSSVTWMRVVYELNEAAG